MTQEMTDAVQGDLQRYRDENSLLNLPNALMKLLAQDASKNGGISPEDLRKRLPSRYHDHALAMSVLVNSRISSGAVAPTPGHPPQGQPTGAQPSSEGTAPAATPPSEPSAPASEGEPVFEASQAITFVATHRQTEFRPLEPLRISMFGEGFLLEWTPVEGDDVLYRVTRSVARQEVPEWGQVSVVTRSTTQTDNRLPLDPKAHYQVWAYVASNGRPAAMSQPILAAEASVVIPPQDVVIQAQDGRVVGQWRMVPDGCRVHIYRKPTHVPGPVLEPQFRVDPQPGSAYSGGFVDDGVVGGQEYIYGVALEVVENGVGELSPSVDQRLEARMRIQPVRDLHVGRPRTNEHGKTVVDVEWTPLGGTSAVRIFVSKQEPPIGLDQESFDESALPRLGLGDALPYPVNRIGDKAQILDALWEEGWTRMHFTAVTFLDGKIQPSRTVTVTSSQVSITEARIHQRVTGQVITLTWPQPKVGESGRDETYTFENVQVFKVPPGTEVEAAIQGHPLTTISASDYRDDGGLRVSLGAQPCRLALVPVSKQRGENHQGKPFLLDYVGLRQFGYRISRSGLGSIAGAFTKSVKVSVQLRAVELTRDCPAFVMVRNEERLPLDLNDGELCTFTVKDDSDGASSRHMQPEELSPNWSETVWVSEVPVKGYLRVFANVTTRDLPRVAVMDAPIKQLRMG